MNGRIGVTGPNGRLGRELVRQGCLPVEANVTDGLALRLAIDKIKHDTIIHCAGFTNVDACEISPLEAARVNMGGAFMLSQVYAGRIVYISTDYIFDGQNGPYSETDSPNPIGVYGWSKLGGELVVTARQNPNDLVIRTTILYSHDSDNFVTAVIGKLRRGEAVTVPSRLIGSPTYIPHLAEGILAAIEKGQNGILNIAGSRVMSRYELARLVARVMAADDGLIFPGPVAGKTNRPLKVGLKIDKAKSLGIPIYDPTIGIKELVHALETMETR